MAELREIVKAWEKQISALQAEVEKLKTAIDEPEQYSGRNNLRIPGIPEEENDFAAVTLEMINKKCLCS